ncbi:MAG: carboxypeptidase regulatory-like domain-containing protein [Limisphaerales bacterium]
MRLFCVTLPALLASAIVASAFVADIDSNNNPRKWNFANLATDQVSPNVVNPTTKAIRYFIAADAYSGTNSTNAAAEINAVRASFDQWQAISGSILKFEYAGVIAPGVDINPGDNTNVIFWAKTSTTVGGGHDNISGTTGVTYFSYSPDDNALTEADIVFNGVQWAWFTDFNRTSVPNNTFFVEAVATHEIGHFIGLNHSPVGGATMLARGAAGVGNTQGGLSSDEVSAVHFLYPQASLPATLGDLKGRVTMDGVGILGAAVIAEDATGNVINGTVTDTNGLYDLSDLPPGNYQVRVTPLDPANASTSHVLIRGRDITFDPYDSAQTGFLPTTNLPVVIPAGQVTFRSFSVVNNAPAFRIEQIRPPTESPSFLNRINAPATIQVGQSNFFVGVYGANLPTADATLFITGDGLTLGSTTFTPSAFFGFNLMSVSISVASTATPGLRSFVVQQGTNLAYANGFLEVQAAFPDWNFDGINDRFQRLYFPLWTAPEAAGPSATAMYAWWQRYFPPGAGTEAGPSADPDGDTMNNLSEYTAGTNPTDATSLLRVDRVTLSASGSTVTWESVSGKRYQVFGRDDLAGSFWQAVGTPVAASGATAQTVDPSATGNFRFYRVQVLP